MTFEKMGLLFFFFFFFSLAEMLARARSRFTSPFFFVTSYFLEIKSKLFDL
jgi:hypothetical protein